MIQYKITTPHNGCIQYTQTGKDLYCTILDKFNIEYKIEEIAPTKENGIPHSEIRRMESEGVYEEKFDKSNSSGEKPKDIQDWEETPFGKSHKEFTTNVGYYDDIENSEYDAVSLPKKDEPYIDDEYDY
tara:strand:- start:332 stop:718 length:387 start_codon:yes stop_codon:yes gene_type:complete